MSGISLAMLMWMGQCAARKAAMEQRRLAESAEAILSRSQKAAKSSSTGQDPPAGNLELPEKWPVDDITTHSNYDYSGAKAPWRWADLSPSWGLCTKGRLQSPVDISGAKVDPRLKALKFHYQHGVSTIKLTNHTVQLSVDAGSWLEFDGERFDLKQVYFRTPAEHRINGLPFEMEVQLRHEELTGKQLFLSLQVTTGKKHPELHRIVELLPRFSGESNDIERLNWESFLPPKRTYWHYIGSLTFPPCSEQITWIILTQTIGAPLADVNAFAKLQQDNVRPTQSIGKRLLTRSNR